MAGKNSFYLLIFFFILFIGAAIAYTFKDYDWYASYFIFGCAIVLAYVISAAIKVANQWDRAVVLRLGGFYTLKGPGQIESPFSGCP